jgi:hypothetical protein
MSPAGEGQFAFVASGVAAAGHSRRAARLILHESQSVPT